MRNSNYKIEKNHKNSNIVYIWFFFKNVTEILLMVTRSYDITIQANRWIFDGNLLNQWMQKTIVEPKVVPIKKKNINQYWCQEGCQIRLKFKKKKSFKNINIWPKDMQMTILHYETIILLYINNLSLYYKLWITLFPRLK